MEAVKGFLAPKTFGTWAYICSIVQVLCGVVFTGITIALKEGEAEKFTCYVSPESTLVYKTQVDKACFSKYQQHYNGPLPFYIFVLLNTWFPIVVAVVYSLSVRHRVDQFDSNDGEAGNHLQNRTFYVFRLYFVHLATRVLCGVLCTILQHTLLFPKGFDFKFGCNLPPTVLPTKISKNTSVSQLNNTAACENSSDKHIMWMTISVFNALFSFIIFVEIIRLCRRFPVCKYITGKECDTQFIKDYLPRKEYHAVETELPCVSSNFQQTTVSLNLQQEPVSSNLQQESVSPNLQQCVDDYKRQVLRSPRSIGLNLGTKSKDDFDELYINLVIHTERAPHKFSKGMERHEIYDVYMEVPEKSTRLKKVKDLFYPDKDTKKKIPRSILVVGRPGIGKTVLTEKIMRDWANGVDKFYRQKIPFYFKFRWFNVHDMKDMTLKTFLRYGTELSDQIFDKIYEEITKHSEKAILIFDGLDEFNGNFECLNDLPPPNDPDCPMSPISLFGKLVSSRLLPKATVLVTSRPTAHKFYSKFNFDRTVEIIGFTKARIEEYVIKFCHSHDGDDLGHKIWNHIESSSDLLNSCYIPVNCRIVVTILFERVQANNKNEIESLPTTLTELYQAAVTHLDQNHFRNVGGHSSEEAIKNLQFLAFKGIEPMQLIFDSKSFDEQMKQSGLLNNLSHPHSLAQTQFCFIHLTIQEFLAAKHVIEMFSPEEINQFIFSHIKSSKWELVLQFIAGLLGREIEMFQKNHYKDCVWAFGKSFELTSEECVFHPTENYTSLLIMKCLREVKDEEIVKEACQTTAINDVVALTDTSASFGMTTSDWSAVFFVCKHMKNLKKLDLLAAGLSQESYQEALSLLKQRCIEELSLGTRLDWSLSSTKSNVFKTLMESTCSLNHEHSKLIKLNINDYHITHEISLTMCEFFRDGHPICLRNLDLFRCGITLRELSVICEVLDNKLCPELTYLDLGFNNISDEGLRKLCNAVTEHKLLKLTKLHLSHCSLTNECVPNLCELLTDEYCSLIDLSLANNKDINNAGLRIFCERALKSEHCKLKSLDLQYCSYLTVDCLPVLCNTLQDKHCKLISLSLSANNITDEGFQMLCELALAKENCKLLDLYLRNCLLTDKCIPDLCKTLQDEYCRLNKLDLRGNEFTEEGEKHILETETHEHCKARGLEIYT